VLIGALLTGKEPVVAMHFSITERFLAGLAAAYFGYRVWTGMTHGIMFGDGDQDVHPDTHPVAFSLTAVTSAAVAVLCAYIALGPSINALFAWAALK
jgi:hypothetical protein